MTFSEVFTAYYNLYRAEKIVPPSTDDEYTIAMRLANEAISRWENYDNTYWKELFTTAVLEGETPTLTTNVTVYDAPDSFKEAGGSVKALDSGGNVQARYPILEPQDVQFRTQAARYCYFTGNPSDGYTLHLNPAPDSALNGLKLDYDFYKAATLFTGGNDVTEMSNPYFIVHRMLANRFRVSRNPYYNSAITDAEEALKLMQIQNNSGTWANPWAVPDNSGAQFGATGSVGW